MQRNQGIVLKVYETEDIDDGIEFNKLGISLTHHSFLEGGVLTRLALSPCSGLGSFLRR